MLLLLGGLVTPAMAGVSWSPYDDFSTGVIDATKWTPLETVREIRSGKLVSSLRAVSSPGQPNNELQFANPSTITSFQADVRLNAYTAPPGGSSRIRLRGGFYGSGTSGTGKTGDIAAEIALTAGATNGIGYAVFRCTNSDCSSVTDVIPFTSLSPTVTLGQAYTLGIAWDGSVFTFSLNGVATAPVDPKTAAPITRATPTVLERVLASQLRFVNAGGMGSVAGDFANVYVNGALYDNFSGSRLDPARWASLDVVSEIQNGAWVSKAAAAGQAGEVTRAKNRLYFLNQNAVTAAKADLTVTAVQTSANASAQVRVFGGAFYNDGASTGTSDYTGDVAAYFRIISTDGGPLQVNFQVERYEETNGDIATVIADETLGTVNVGETHTLQMSWDGSAFTYQLDGGAPRTFDPKPF